MQHTFECGCDRAPMRVAWQSVRYGRAPQFAGRQAQRPLRHASTTTTAPIKSSAAGGELACWLRTSGNASPLPLRHKVVLEQQHQLDGWLQGISTEGQQQQQLNRRLQGISTEGQQRQLDGRLQGISVAWKCSSAAGCYQDTEEQNCGRRDAAGTTYGWPATHRPCLNLAPSAGKGVAK